MIEIDDAQLDNWIRDVVRAAGDDAPVADPLASPVSTGATRRSWLGVAAAVVLAVGGVSAVAYVAGRSDERTVMPSESTNADALDPTTLPPTVVLPDLMGLNIDDALDRLDTVGLVAAIIESNDPAGVFETVVAMDPVAGSAATTGSTVMLTVAVPPGGRGPLDYATTEAPIPTWPALSISDPAANTSAYGLAKCDDSTWTKYASVASPTGVEHSYQGTLCPFITLAEPTSASIVNCASITTGTHYARCQRRTDLTDTTGPGTAIDAQASDDQQQRRSRLPGATSSEEPSLFGDQISAIGTTRTTDAGAAITLLPPDRDAIVCFSFEFPGAAADGCLGETLLRSGLAYGSFQDNTGAVHLIGIVPDGIDSVDIAGQTVPVIDNTWYVTADIGENLDFTVTSNTGITASTTTP